MRVPCNLHEVKEIEPRPEGTYPVRVTEEPKIVTKDGKTPYIEVKMQYLDPECPVERRKTVFFVSASKTDGWNHFKIKELCEAFDVLFDESGFDTADFVNKEAYISVMQEVYNGKVGNKVSHWLKTVA